MHCVPSLSPCSGHIQECLKHPVSSSTLVQGEGLEAVKLSGHDDEALSARLFTLQAACAAFDVRGRHHITIPKRYTSSVTWEPYHYRLVQDSQPLDLNKGTHFSVCPSCLPGILALSL